MKSQKFLSLAPIFCVLALNVISLNVYADDAINRADYMDEGHNRKDGKHNHGDDEHYVYTNDGQVKNTVTGFKVARNGSLTKIDQWPTGGTGCPHGFGPATRTSISKSGDILFVSNGFGLPFSDCESVPATISVFKGASHGKLHLVKLISDPANLTPGDTSVASFGSCLIVGSTNGKKLLSYKLPTIRLVSNLSVVDNTGSPVGIVDMKVTKVGETRYAAATLFNVDTDDFFINQITVTQINTNTCALATPTIITTSGAKVAGGSTGLGFSPDGRKMYVADANGDFDTGQTIVEAFEFPSGTPLPGSPYVYPYPAAGNNSETVLASKDGKCLFVGYQFTATVTSIPLRNGIPPVSGSSSVVANQVGDSTVPDIAIGMANDIDRKLLYVGIHPNTDDPLPTNYVTTQLIGKDCTLKEATGGSASTDVSTNDGLLTSIVATGDD